MLKIGIVGCGLQAATIAGYTGIYGDDYEVTSVMDINLESARARLAEKQVKLNARYSRRKSFRTSKSISFHNSANCGNAILIV